MISQAIYQEYKSKYDTFYAAAKRFESKNGWLCLTPEMLEQLPPRPTNEETSLIEVYEFITDPPERYFAYVNEEDHTVTTWMGDVLGSVTFGYEFKSNMGDTRVPVTVKARNGYMYHGTYFESSGDYCRIKRGKKY